MLGVQVEREGPLALQIVPLEATHVQSLFDTIRGLLVESVSISVCSLELSFYSSHDRYKSILLLFLTY